MKNTFNLAFIYFKQTLSQMFKTKKRASALSNSFLVLAIFIVVAFAMGFAYYGTAEQFKAIGHPEFILVVGLMFSSFFVLMLTIHESQSNYYKTKDYDLLASLPIKNWSIISAKYLSSYFVTFIYSFIIVFPAYIIYFMFCPITFYSILYIIISFFFIPTFSQLVGSLLAFIVSFITSKLNNKKIVNSILTIVITVGFIVFIYFLNSGLMQNLFIEGVPLWIKIVFPHINFLFISVITGSFIDFIIFIILTTSFAVISIAIVTIGYKKINSNLLSSSAKKSKKPLSYNQFSIFKSLIKKEAKTFFNTPIYFINSIIGPILVIVLAISMGIGEKQISMTLDSSFPSEYFIIMYVCFSSMCLGIGVPTSASISIEGKKFYLLKSLPIPINTILNAKLAFNLILNIPFVILSSIIFICITSCSLTQSIFIILIPLISMLAFCGLGLLTNLKWPKLEWTNEAQAVKQSFSLLVSMMSAIVISILPFLIYFSLFNEISSVISINEYFAIYLGYIVILGIIFYSLLYTHGKKLYNKI